MLKRIFKRLEDIYAAAAFEEGGKVEIAREILRKEKREQKIDRFTLRSRIQLMAPGIKR